VGGPGKRGASKGRFAQDSFTPETGSVKHAVKQQ
jgi:hypothetical protein